MEETNEEFKQTDGNQELKTHTPQGNIGRNYEKKRIFRKCDAFYT